MIPSNSRDWQIDNVCPRYDDAVSEWRVSFPFRSSFDITKLGPMYSSDIFSIVEKLRRWPTFMTDLGTDPVESNIGMTTCHHDT